MKAASAKEIKDDLKRRSQSELLEICLRLARFKKENKELLTYLLFESDSELLYIESIKEYMDEEFANLNTRTPYIMKKSVRKILTNIKKYIRYSPKKETEITILLYFCKKLQSLRPAITRNAKVYKIYMMQKEYIHRKLPTLHEDLQFDFGEELGELIIK